MNAKMIEESAQTTNESGNCEDLEFGMIESGLAGSAGASLTSEALAIRQPIVSHTTRLPKHVESILSNGVRLNSHPDNAYGGQAFYVAEDGFSIHEARGNRTIVFRLSSRTKIFDAEKGNAWKLGKKLTSVVRDGGYDAIQYEGSYTKSKTTFNCNYNLAIVNNPQYLTPIGVYPTPSNRPSAISLPTIRGIQILGLVGTTYFAYQAGQAIINSEQPVLEAGHQAALFSAVVRGGAKGGAIAIRPCAMLGAAFPAAAPYTVPVCIVTGSILGGGAAAISTELVWNVVMDPLRDAVLYPSYRFLQDVQIIAASRVSAPIVHPDGLEFAIAQELVSHQPSLVAEAENRIQARFDAIDAFGNTISNAQNIQTEGNTEDSDSQTRVSSTASVSQIQQDDRAAKNLTFFTSHRSGNNLAITTMSDHHEVTQAQAITPSASNRVESHQTQQIQSVAFLSPLTPTTISTNTQPNVQHTVSDEPRIIDFRFNGQHHRLEVDPGLTIHVGKSSVMSTQCDNRQCVVTLRVNEGRYATIQTPSLPLDNNTQAHETNPTALNNHNQDLIARCEANMRNLQDSSNEFRGISAVANNIDVSKLHGPRVTLPYGSVSPTEFARQSLYLHANLASPPATNNHYGFFKTGGEGSYQFCDSFGNCRTVSFGGGSGHNDCHSPTSSSSKCSRNF